MRLFKLVAGTLLALCFSLPAFGASRCDEAAQNRWLTSCAWALDGVRRAETPYPTDPAELNTDALFKAQANFSDEFVDSCYRLSAEPDRVPQEYGTSLRLLGWPPPGDPCTRDAHLRWLRACEGDALALPGLTRAELLNNFIEDGGLSTYEDRTYIHRRCGYLKVEVHFSLTHEQAESPDDAVESASPYVGCAIFD
ncbi:MAG TPA: hypothetical protein VGM86_28170 [Thermoanaerobaculia bacterium]|jgi:hypothetical protein